MAVAVMNGAVPDAYYGAAVPRTVSARRHLRDGLPEVYRQGDFAMRFLQAFEEVLDPVVATLDSLQAHLDADLAPDHALAGMAAWLGVDEVEGLPAEGRRRALRSAGELARRRGTRSGLELALELFFPGTPMRVVDHGGVVVDEAPRNTSPPAPGASFDVYVDEALRPEEQMAVAGTIERWKPVHARYRLRVRKDDTGETLAAPQPSPPSGDGP